VNYHSDKPPRLFSPPSIPGFCAGLVLVALSYTPSLLPRPYLMQGVITGIAMMSGYGVGVFVAWVVKRFTDWRPAPQTRRVIWVFVLAAAVAVFAAAVVAGTSGQNDVRALLQMGSTGLATVATSVPVALVVAFLLLLASRGLRGAGRRFARLFEHHQMPHRFSVLVGGLVTAVVVLAGVSFGIDFFYFYSGVVFGQKNEGTRQGVTQPTVPERSGGPGSLVTWQSLGYEGRNFVGRGPSAADIEKFSGEPALQPVRVYVGLDSASTAAERAALAVKELERTGAFSRSLLIVMGCTGTGWIEPQSANPPEYMWGGDTAEVTIQYSDLPSWISTLVDRTKATDAGKALFDAVYAKWSALPEGDRPLLVAYGLSLGSYACQAAFKDSADITARTDGAYFAGTPNMTEPWRTIEDTRDSGSPEWQPVYGGGRTLRFASGTSSFAHPDGPWDTPRVAYLQHGSDPVVWWSPNLLLQRPGWLAEPRAPDVSPRTMWFPLVTFLQVTVDQFYGTTVPPGHGHNYGNMSVGTWSQIVPPPGWTKQQEDKLQTEVNGYAIE
jgi:uncharacterized membrane protein